jgi:hypothetical protein
VDDDGTVGLTTAIVSRKGTRTPKNTKVWPITGLLVDLGILVPSRHFFFARFIPS